MKTNKPAPNKTEESRVPSPEIAPVPEPGRRNAWLNWFLSGTVRQATQMRKHVRRILNAQRDLLSPQAIQNVEIAMVEIQRAVETAAPKKALVEQMTNLEKVANKWLKPYPNAGMRENVEVLLVAIAVAMGIRTFFIQPFKIPTGSMQPTLFGVTSVPDYSHPFSQSSDANSQMNFTVPNPVGRFFEFWYHGISYTHVVAKSDGAFRGADEPTKLLLFNLKQRFQVGEDWYTVWFPPDGLLKRAGVGEYSRAFHKGEDIIKIKVKSGDHLFVDRMTYNFRRPTRGEIIVFKTQGIQMLPQDQFYIKRMVAMGGEKVRIGNDRHLAINGQRLDANTPHFENVYSFDPNKPPRESSYSGHLNAVVAGQIGLSGLAPNFPNETTEVSIAPNHYIVMGDNTVNSFDSRAWGDFPRDNVIGKSFFVYWPISERFGWGQR
jgi:signal peptidase I